MTPLERWFFARRVEFAVQVCLLRVQQKIEPPPETPLEDVLRYLLISSWQDVGCVALWNHMDRGGVPHPDNPEGLTP